MKLFLIGVFGWGFGKNGRFSWYLDGQNVVRCWQKRGELMVVLWRWETCQLI
jgi:hypothetical protein